MFFGNVSILSGFLSILFLGLSAGIAQETCTWETNAYVFLHPFFRDKPWGVTADTVDWTLPDSLCALQPRTFSTTQYNENRSFGVFLTHDNRLYVVEMWAQCQTSSLCSECSIRFFTPYQIPLSSTPANQSPLYLIRKPFEEAGLLRFAFATSEGTLSIITFDFSKKEITQEATITFSTETETPGILCLSGDAPPSIADSALWVGGENGFLRHLPLFGTDSLVAQVVVLPTPDSIISISHKFLTTSSGGVYQYTGDLRFTPIDSVGSSFLRVVTDDGGVGDNGIVRLFDSTYYFGASDYRHFNLIKLPEGSAVELIDKDWQYSFEIYADEPSIISGTEPDSVFSNYLGTQPLYLEEIYSYSLELRVFDRDLNYHLPSFSVGNLDGTRRDVPLDSLAGRPGMDCTYGVTSFEDSTISIHFDNDSIVIEAGIIVGSLTPSCPGRCYWIHSTYRKSVGWDNGDTLFVALQNDTLACVNGLLHGTPIQRKRFEASPMAPCIRLSHGRVLFTVPAKHQEAQLTIFDVSGRRFLSTRIHKGAPLSIDRSRLPSVFIARMTSGTKTLTERLLTTVGTR